MGAIDISPSAIDDSNSNNTSTNKCSDPDPDPDPSGLRMGSPPEEKLCKALLKSAQDLEEYIDKVSGVSM